MRILTVATMTVLVAAVVSQLLDGHERRSDLGVEVGSVLAGLAEVVLGLVIILALVRHGRRRSGDALHARRP